MYDFYFGTKEEIAKDEEKFLITIKRMLPKWCNSIPDSEYVALYRIGDELCNRLQHPPVIVETGTGASSIALAFLAMKYGGTTYTWDINGEKGSFIRGVVNETICNYLDKNINTHWKLIPFDSTSPYLGVRVVKELQTHVDLSFHDSRHALDVLINEIEGIKSLYKNGSIVAIDDANYTNAHTDFDYINLFRKKLGLPEVPIHLVKLIDNESKMFCDEVDEYLREFFKVKRLSTYYEDNFQNDIFFGYYANETDTRAKLNMEKIYKLRNRFASWEIL